MEELDNIDFIQFGQHLLCELITLKDIKISTFVFECVYASTNNVRRKELWRHIQAIFKLGLPSIFIGDFSYILGPEEKRGGKPFEFNPEVREFAYFISSSSLIDLGFDGDLFIWCNNQYGRAQVSEHQDRALVNGDWFDFYPKCSVSHLSRIGSDHCPVF